MIQVSGLTIAHKGGRTLLSNASAHIEQGTLCALIGRNGSGKSSLLRVMCGVDKPVSGSVAIDGIDVNHCRPDRLARLLSVVTTERIRVGHLTCQQVVELGRAPFTGAFGRLSNADHRIVNDAFETTGAAHLVSRTISTLSDGEAQRVMLARALAQDTPVILLDEPTSFLDVPGRKEITALLATLAHVHGKTIVYSTHELDLAFAHADSVMLLKPPTLTLATPNQLSISNYELVI